MFSMFVFTIVGGIVGLIAYEVIDEVRRVSDELHDRYHE